MNYSGIKSAKISFANVFLVYFFEFPFYFFIFMVSVGIFVTIIGIPSIRVLIF